MVRVTRRDLLSLDLHFRLTLFVLVRTEGLLIKGARLHDVRGQRIAVRVRTRDVDV